MTITLHIPPDSERELREAFGPEFDRVALEAIACEGYRSGRISAGKVAKLLGLENRFAAEEWLASRGLHWNYSAVELEADRATLDSVLGKEPS